MTSRWVAFLRGINVGGGNQVKMAELRSTFESLGCADVATYINSGNVVFDADALEHELRNSIAAAIAGRHGLDIPVVVRAAADLAVIAERHPDAGGEIEPKFLHVLFLSDRPDTATVGEIDRDRYAPDTWTVEGREVYATYPNGAGRSKLTIEVFERAFGVTATGRNLNTVRKMVTLAAPT